jgi:hypothetical protein
LFLEDGIPEQGVELDQLGIDEVWGCHDLVTGKEFSLGGLPDDFFEKNDVESGVTVLTITSTMEGQIVHHRGIPGSPQDTNITVAALTNETNYVDEPLVELSLNTVGDSISTSLTTRADSGAWTTKVQGDVSMLVVRVTDGAGVEPDLSAEEISDVLFGTYGDAINLVSTAVRERGGGCHEV